MNTLITPGSGNISFSNLVAAGSNYLPPLSSSARIAYTRDGGLTIVSTASSSERFNVEGNFGSLLTVNDSATGRLFNVNDISGFPLFFVTDNGTVSSTGVIHAPGGNSNQWNTAYTNLVSNSANYLSGASTSYVDATFVKLSGDTMTGGLSTVGLSANNIYSTGIIRGTNGFTIAGAISGRNITTSFGAGSATGAYSFAAGSGKAFGAYSHAEGSSNVASGDSSHAEGSSTIASGEFSHTEGAETKASGIHGHAEGYITIASGQTSHAQGSYNTAAGYASHAEGISNVASGMMSHAEGAYNFAAANVSHVEGNNNVVGQPIPIVSYDSDTRTLVVAAANAAFLNIYGPGTLLPFNIIAGENNDQYRGAAVVQSRVSNIIVFAADQTLPNESSDNGFIYAYYESGVGRNYGTYSHAEGYNNIASGAFGAHAEGSSNVAAGNASHAEGASTRASGDSSHAEGYYTAAAGAYSHAAGAYAAAAHDRTWIWQGSTATNTISTTRTDQFLVSAAGGVYIPGNVGIGTNNNANALTVNGGISGNGIITALGGNSNQWNTAYTNLVSNSANYLSGASTSYVNANFVKLSGDTMTGSLTVTGNISGNGIITALGGNSNQWNTAYTNLVNNSGAYLSGFNAFDASAIAAASASWNSNYTTTNLNSASWSGAYTSFNANSSFYDAAVNELFTYVISETGDEFITEDSLLMVDSNIAGYPAWNSTTETVVSLSAGWSRSSATASLSFGSVSARGYADQYIFLNGAAIGDAVFVTCTSVDRTTNPFDVNLFFDCLVSSANTITIRAHNPTDNLINNTITYDYRVILFK